jgi:hypothetical protein
MSINLKNGDSTKLSVVVIKKTVVLNSLLFNIQILQYLKDEYIDKTQGNGNVSREVSLLKKKPWDIFLRKHMIETAQCKLRFASRFIRPFPKDMK